MLTCVHAAQAHVLRHRPVRPPKGLGQPPSATMADGAHACEDLYKLFAKREASRLSEPKSLRHAAETELSPAKPKRAHVGHSWTIGAQRRGHRGQLLRDCLRHRC